jgi:hypothetical protein
MSAESDQAGDSKAREPSPCEEGTLGTDGIP